LRTASSALLALALAACAGGASPPAPTGAEREVPFSDEGATTQSAHGASEPRIDAVADGDRWRITVYQGQQTTGGYEIRVQRIVVAGAELRVVARFVVPPPGAVTIQVLTSPAHAVSVGGVTFDHAILMDQDGRERARVTAR